MAKVRVSTFNCENLFSRPAILNYDDNDDARIPLGKLVQVDTILQKATYSAADQTKILALIAELADFIDLNEMRTKLISRHKVNGVMEDFVRPAGRSDWVGGIALKRNPIPIRAQISTAAVIEAVDADVQVVVEVEDRTTLERFAQNLLKAKPYAFNVLLDGNDDRGIDVGVLSRHPIGAIRTHVFDADPANPKTRIFSRDCLEVEILLPGGKSLFVLANHFKSQGYGTQASNDARRKLQADRVAAILGGYDLKKEVVIVAGDFNDSRETTGPLTTLLGTANLFDVINETFTDPLDRWTYKDRKKIDYMLVSKPLKAALVAAGIERRGLFEADKLTKNTPSGQVFPFPTVTTDKNDASDHAAVWAEFGV